ncbi:DHH family phosphoesterase [Patescibacteria group bacterium]|nr:DHH family phosphoesterase [Patescibacteria group bacterium]
MEIKNLKKAAKRILSAIKKDERIVLFGDADLDGTTSVIILEEAIKNLGGRVSLCYFPDRGIEGYGLNENALKILSNYAPALLILLDCGIGNFKEVKVAKKMGFEVIIIEHHEVLAEVPQALVVNPKQKGDKYPFKFLATCGLSFKLTSILLGSKTGGGRVASKHLEQGFLELAALGTLADMMPQVEDNQIFIEKGLDSLPFTFRPGLQAFFKIFPQQNFSSRELAQKIISILQITDSKNHLTESYLVLSSQDTTQASQLLEKLSAKSSQRQQLIKELTSEITQKAAAISSPLIFEGGPEFPHVLTGAIASRICHKFKKPTFIFNTNQNLSKGSVRTPKGVNSVEALTKCSSLLEVYGGHPQASGFTVKAENLEKFKECLIEYFKKL